MSLQAELIEEQITQQTAAHAGLSKQEKKEKKFLEAGEEQSDLTTLPLGSNDIK